MYTIECDGVLIHDQKSPDTDIHLISPRLSLQENSAGSLEFTIPPANPGYSIIQKMVSVIVVRKEGNTIWTGRPFSEHEDFYGRKKITCEGALAYLNDTLQDPMEYSNTNVRYIFRSIITAHNAKVEAKRQFKFGSITIQDLDDSYRYETNYNNTWETIKTNFIDRLEGHVSIHYSGSGIEPYIDYTDTYNTTTQEINFGENLLDFSKDYDLSSLFTVIFPKGKEVTESNEHSDAGDDANPSTSNRNVTINNVRLAHSVITSDLRVTIKVTSMTVTTGVAYKGEHNLKLVIGEETIVSKDATYTSSVVNGKPIKTYQSAKACADAAASAVTTKINNDTAKVTYNRAQDKKTVSVVLNVFGKSTTLNVTIPAADNTSELISGTQKREYTTIASVNNGSVYLENTTAIAKYGRIEREVEFNDIDNPKQLLNLARRYIQANQFDSMALTVSAIDLHFLNPSIQSLGFLDQVRCVSAVHGMDKYFPITQIDLPFDAPDQVKYTLGKSTSSSMTAKSVANSSNFYSALENVPSFKNTLDSAKNDMTAILNRRTNGYVNIVQESDVSQAIVISDTPDWLNATKVWKWDINGLGYSDSTVEDVNYEGPSSVADGRWYKMGMTMDGTIVADVIKTGILEDGMGYNYWNLSTGEFSLQPSSVILDNDSHYTIEDMYNDFTDTSEIVEEVKTTAETAQATADEAKESYTFSADKETGVVNLLNGTGVPSIPAQNGGSWSSRNWRSASGGNGKRTIIDATRTNLGVNPPNSNIKKAVQISGSTNSKVDDIAQDGVELEPETAYVISCYAMGTGNLRFQIGTSISGTARYISKTYTLSNITKWKRYSFAFKTGTDGDKTIGNTAGIKDGKTSVFFGNTGTSSSKYIIICGMKIEKGNTPTDWFPSVEDLNATAETYSKQYKSAIEANAKKETKKQLDAYDKSLVNEKVLGKLTAGCEKSGLYMAKIGSSKKLSLLINADYIKTGALSAGLIKTGWIQDKYKKNQWNLATGYFKTTNMSAVNMAASGSFESGSKKSYSMILSKGMIDGYRKGTWVCSIDPTSSIRNVSTGKIRYGLKIRAKGNIDIRSPEISIRNSNDTGVSTITVTKTLNFKCVTSIHGSSYNWETHRIEVVNGLITGIY